jgi:hypothetical protein
MSFFDRAVSAASCICGLVLLSACSEAPLDVSEGERLGQIEDRITARGFVRFEQWLNVPGTTISEIPLSSPPSVSGQLSSLEMPANAADQYGVRIRGFVVPPVTGSYSFWIASDDNGELSLGTNADPATKRRIAHHTQWTGHREWNKFVTQRSAPISLVAGQRYYIEALMKEGTGADHLAVGWLKPGQTGSVPSEIIPGAQLSAFEPAPQPIVLEYQAEDAPYSDRAPIETQHAGFTGSGYVNPDNAAGPFLNWYVEAPTAGIATLDIRYANGSSSARQGHLTASSGVVNPSLSFPPTGAWTSWSTVRVSVPFNAGGNDLNLQGINAAGLPNLDKITLTYPPSEVLVWPLSGSIGSDWVVSEYVDIDPAPTSARDFTGGSRTFEGNPSTEIDVSSLRDMDDASAIVRAIASGTIMAVENGHFDRHLEPNSEPMNFVTIAHDNGLTAVYGHLKQGSVFAGVGQRVAAGQWLAIAGSSGNSDRAHLHLELRDAYGNVVCPFRQNLWQTPVPYDAPPTFMDLMTRHGPMDTQRVKDPRPNLTELVAGADLGLGASFAGGQSSTQARIVIRRPNDSVFATHTLSGSELLRPHSFWSFNQTIPANEALGSWTINADVAGVVQQQTTFELVSPLQTVNLEAEEATLSATVAESQHAGFSGTGYANPNNATGSFVEWHVSVPLAGTAPVVIRYANGTTTARSAALRLNGVVVNSNLTFAPTGAWSSWSTVTVNLNLQAGVNDIRLTSINAVGAPNFDKIDVTFARDTRIDSDGDRLADVVETNSGVFRGASDPGTDPLVADTDADGISDGDESLGSRGGLNLPAFGLSPLRKEILLEHDWFEDSVGCARHSHRPTANMMAEVAAAFANSGVSNPDGSRGVTLINDYGQGGAFTGGNLVPDADGVLNETVYGEFQDHKLRHFAANRLGYFHYNLHVHYYNVNSGSSGVAEILGDDLVVSLGCLYDNGPYVRNTILHELGHNLNLHHGGLDAINYKPNYNSVMNYRYQFGGADLNCDASGDGPGNYSHGENILLREESLNEAAGVCGNVAIDWNFSGTIQANLAYDVNQDAMLGELVDWDDWSNLDLRGPSFSRPSGSSVRQVAPLRIVECEPPPLP